MAQDTLSFSVSIRDRVSATGIESENDNIVNVPITIIVLDENDNPPEFQNVSTAIDYCYLFLFFTHNFLFAVRHIRQKLGYNMINLNSVISLRRGHKCIQYTHHQNFELI
uniref:Cadherin domain-containing protein n=1 Tax=Anopheles maculatus TaxID=74869 RepID=A0A182SNT6_9DIPT